MSKKKPSSSAAAPQATGPQGQPSPNQGGNIPVPVSTPPLSTSQKDYDPYAPWEAPLGLSNSPIAQLLQGSYGMTATGNGGVAVCTTKGSIEQFDANNGFAHSSITNNFFKSPLDIALGWNNSGDLYVVSANDNWITCIPGGTGAPFTYSPGTNANQPYISGNAIRIAAVGQNNGTAGWIAVTNEPYGAISFFNLNNQTHLPIQPPVSITWSDLGKNFQAMDLTMSPQYDTYVCYNNNGKNAGTTIAWIPSPELGKLAMEAVVTWSGSVNSVCPSFDGNYVFAVGDAVLTRFPAPRGNGNVFSNPTYIPLPSYAFSVRTAKNGDVYVATAGGLCKIPNNGEGGQASITLIDPGQLVPGMAISEEIADPQNPDVYFYKNFTIAPFITLYTTRPHVNYSSAHSLPIPGRWYSSYVGGDHGAQTYYLAQGATLPPDLSLQPSGEIAGHVPQQIPFHYPFSVYAKNADGLNGPPTVFSDYWVSAMLFPLASGIPNGGNDIKSGKIQIAVDRDQGAGALLVNANPAPTYIPIYYPKLAFLASATVQGMLFDGSNGILMLGDDFVALGYSKAAGKALLKIGASNETISLGKDSNGNPVASENEILVMAAQRYGAYKDGDSLYLACTNPAYRSVSLFDLKNTVKGVLSPVLGIQNDLFSKTPQDITMAQNADTFVAYEDGIAWIPSPSEGSPAPQSVDVYTPNGTGQADVKFYAISLSRDEKYVFVSGGTFLWQFSNPRTTGNHFQLQHTIDISQSISGYTSDGTALSVGNDGYVYLAGTVGDKGCVVLVPMNGDQLTLSAEVIWSPTTGGTIVKLARASSPTSPAWDMYAVQKSSTGELQLALLTTRPGMTDVIAWAWSSNPPPTPVPQPEALAPLSPAYYATQNYTYFDIFQGLNNVAKVHFVDSTFGNQIPSSIPPGLGWHLQGNPPQNSTFVVGAPTGDVSPVYYPALYATDENGMMGPASQYTLAVKDIPNWFVPIYQTPFSAGDIGLGIPAKTTVTQTVPVRLKNGIFAIGTQPYNSLDGNTGYPVFLAPGSSDYSFIIEAGGLNSSNTSILPVAVGSLMRYDIFYIIPIFLYWNDTNNPDNKAFIVEVNPDLQAWRNVKPSWKRIYCDQINSFGTNYAFYEKIYNRYQGIAIGLWGSGGANERIWVAQPTNLYDAGYDPAGYNKSLCFYDLDAWGNLINFGQINLNENDPKCITANPATGEAVVLLVTNDPEYPFQVTWFPDQQHTVVLPIRREDYRGDLNDCQHKRIMASTTDNVFVAIDDIDINGQNSCRVFRIVSPQSHRSDAGTVATVIVNVTSILPCGIVAVPVNQAVHISTTTPGQLIVVPDDYSTPKNQQRAILPSQIWQSSVPVTGVQGMAVRDDGNFFAGGPQKLTEFSNYHIFDISAKNIGTPSFVADVAAVTPCVNGNNEEYVLVSSQSGYPALTRLFPGKDLMAYDSRYALPISEEPLKSGTALPFMVAGSSKTQHLYLRDSRLLNSTQNGGSKPYILQVDPVAQTWNRLVNPAFPDGDQRTDSDTFDGIAVGPYQNGERVWILDSTPYVNLESSQYAQIGVGTFDLDASGKLINTGYTDLKPLLNSGVNGAATPVANGITVNPRTGDIFILCAIVGPFDFISGGNHKNPLYQCFYQIIRIPAGNKPPQIFTLGVDQYGMSHWGVDPKLMGNQKIIVSPITGDVFFTIQAYAANGFLSILFRLTNPDSGLPNAGQFSSTGPQLTVGNGNSNEEDIYSIAAVPMNQAIYIGLVNNPGQFVLVPDDGNRGSATLSWQTSTAVTGMSKLAVNRNGTVLAGGKGLTAFSLNAVPSYLAGPVVLDAKLPSLYMNQAYNSNGFSEPAPNLIDGFTFKSNDPNATFATEPGTGLPFNINLSSNGSVSGYISAIPGYPGPHTVGVQAIDKNSSPGTTPFTMRVIDLAYMVEPSGFSLPSAQAGEAYAGYQFSAITEQPEPPNVKSPLQFSLVSGSLPPGLSLTSDGKVTGQVSGSAQGTYHFKVAPSNYSYSAGYTNLQPESYTIAVATPASPIMKGPFDLGHVTAGTAYSNTFQATSNPQTFSFSNASLGATQPGQHKVPAGLALNAATGELSPFVDLSVGAGPYVFDIFATNAGGPGTPATYTLTVDEPPLPIMQGPFELAPNAFYGDAYAYQFGATGGPIADYRFDTTTINSTTVSSVPSQVTDGIVDTYCIPNNLTLGSIDSAGKLSGSIDSGIGGGEYIFKVQAKNAHGWGPLARYTLIVESPPVWDPANNAPNGAHKPNDAYLNQVDYSWTPLVYGYPALHFQFSQAPGKKPSPAHSSGSNAYPWGLQIDQDTGRLFSNSDHPLGFEDASHDTLGTGNYSFYIDISNTHNTITVPVRIRVVQHQ